MSKKEQSSTTRHLLSVGFYVVGVFWLALVWGGVKAVSTPDTGRHSHLRGWILLAVAVGAMLATMNHWVKYLRVVLGGGILGGLLATSSGHLLNGGKPFPRVLAAGFTVVLVGCSVISQSLAKRKLTIFDRVVLVAFLAAFVGGFVKDTPISALVGVSLGFTCLFAAWLYNRLSSIREERGRTCHS